MNFLVIPCFNEAKRFQESYWNTICFSPSLTNFTFVFVDDGSQDHTLKILQDFSKNSEVRVIPLNVNVGKANAVRKGFQKILEEEYEECELIGFIDSDSSFNPKEVIEKLNDLNGSSFHHDAFFYSRIKISGTMIRRSESRHIISRIIYTFIARGWAWAPYDTQCGFKIFRKSKLLADIVATPFRTRWFFDIELMSKLATQFGRKLDVKESPLLFWQEQKGSKIKFSQFVSILIEILRARQLVKRMSSLE